MGSAREMRLRIRSVKNIAQVTKALETVSASKVRRAVKHYSDTKSYADKAWKLLMHLARQPGGQDIHPLLVERPQVRRVMVVMVSSDRGLAGAYNVNVLRNTLDYFRDIDHSLFFTSVGKKGRDMLLRRRFVVEYDYEMPETADYFGSSSIGRMVTNEFVSQKVDQVWISYTEFENLLSQKPTIRKLLPLEVEYGGEGFNATHKTSSVFTYEPDESKLLDEIVPRFTTLQIYRSILSSQASEHAARMVAMRNATDNALELLDELRMEYNQARQQAITSDMLDIVGGAEALTQAAF